MELLGFKVANNVIPNDNTEHNKRKMSKAT